MSPEDSRGLIAGHLTGTLTAEERAALYNAALNDSELYLELMDMENMRSALEPEAVRLRIAAALEKRNQSLWASLWSSLAARPAWAVAAVLAVAILMVVLIRPKPGSVTREGAESLEHKAVPAAVSQEMQEEIFRAEPVMRSSVAAEFADLPAGGVLPANSAFTVRVWCASRSVLFAVEGDESGKIQLLQTLAGRDTSMVDEDSKVSFSGNSGDVAGSREIRVVAFPMGVPLDKAALSQASIVRLQIQVGVQ